MKLAYWFCALSLVLNVHPLTADEFVHHFPLKTLYAKGGAQSGERGRTTLDWKFGGEQPIVAYDFGGRTVGGYAIIRVSGFQAQGKNVDGQTVGYPVLRLSYSTHPDGLSATGCFTRRNCAHYLGPLFDNPVLPANVNRFETYTITRAGTYIAPLLQGQERYVRAQLDTPGTGVSIDSIEIRNVGVYAREPRAGSFRCSDERVNRAWDMSVWTCQLASFPNHDAWRVVDGRLLPRKLERGTCAGLCEKATLPGDGSLAADFELRENPHHDSAFGLMVRADGKEDGVLVTVSQPAYCQIVRRRGGVNTALAKMVLDERIVDGVPCHLEARVAGKVVAAYFNGVKIVEAKVADLTDGSRFGLYVEKEWWPVVSKVVAKDAKGRELLVEDFAGADGEGRLPGWDYTRSFKFMADGAKRDRLVWIGDLWWAERSCFYGFASDWPYLRDSLKLLCWNQTPEGYVWAAPYSEIAARPGRGEYGHFPSDEFSAWLVPVAADYFLYTGDVRTMRETVYPGIRAELGLLESQVRPDGLIEQPLERSSNICSMAPTDPTLRSYTHIVYWKAFTDGAWVARHLGHADDAERWQRRADQLKAAIYRHFWNERQGAFNRVKGVAGTWIGTTSMALGTGFVSHDEAVRMATRLAPNGASKTQLVGMRGKFNYGFNEAAFNMLEGGTWFALSDPQWAGAQCCTECGYMTRNNWWDESHPDTTAAGVISTYLMGIEPIEPGYAVFAFDPRFVSRLTFVEGTVPTPHGEIAARWDRKGSEVTAMLSLPEGTKARLRLPKCAQLIVDGRTHDGLELAPGSHAIELKGIDPKTFEDESLMAGCPKGSGEQWFEAPPFSYRRECDPEFEFPYVIDFGAVRNVLEIELTEGKQATHPSELRIDLSTDGINFKTQKELTGLVWQGAGKRLTVDLRTVGGALQARYVRLRMQHPPKQLDAIYGDKQFWEAKFSRVRVKYLAE